MTDARVFSNAASRWAKFEEFKGHAFAALNDISERLAISETLGDDMKLQKVRNRRSRKTFLHQVPRSSFQISLPLTDRNGKQPQLEMIKNNAIEIHTVGAEAKERAHSFTELSRRGNIGDDMDAETLRREYKRCVENATKVAERSANDSANVDIAVIVRLVESVSGRNDNDADIQENFTQIPRRDLRCPVTGSALHNPLKNMQCQHVYSTEGILQLLFQRNRLNGLSMPASLNDLPPNWKTTCPISGCGSTVTRASLERDYQMELTQKQIRGQSSSRRDSMDVEEIVN